MSTSRVSGSSAQRVLQPTRLALWLGLWLGASACAAQPKAAVEAPRAVRVPGAELAETGLALAKRGDDFAAEQYLTAAIQAGYPETAVTRQMVESCLSGGRLESALAHAQGYVERHPEDWIFHHVLASIHFAKGDTKQAREAVNLVLLEHPEHAESQYLLGLILRDQLGGFAGARAAFEQYLLLEPNGAHEAETRAFLRRVSSAPVAVERHVQRTANKAKNR